MLLPKNPCVVLAGQNAWHIWAGLALRPKGKYLPSQLRTQKAGPEPPALCTGRGGAAAGVFRPNGSAKKFASGGGAPLRCCFCACGGPPPNRESKKPFAAP